MKKKHNSKNNTSKKTVKGGESTTVNANSVQVSDAIIAKPLEVKVYGSVERAMKVFRALVQKEKILSKFKEKSRYEKPSDKKRRKKNEYKRKLFEAQFVKGEKKPKTKNFKDSTLNNQNS